MTPPLSPAAQAVMDAFLAELNAQIDQAICGENTLAAVVLRAAVEQVAPEVKSPGGCREGERQCVRRELLAIATELKSAS